MKQVLQNLRNGTTQVVDVPVPRPQRGQVLVRTAASLVSVGTERMLVEFTEKSLIGKARSRPDLVRQVWEKAWREGLLTTLEAAFQRLEQPMPLGYASSGRILELGEGVDDLHIGQRVACAGGGYAVHAEYAVVPRNLIAVLPDEVDFESAAFTTLGAIALHGFRLAQAQLGECVAVIGLGLLGVLAAQIARVAGCRVMGIDLDASRVALARTFGVEAVLRSDAEQAGHSFSRGRGCDAVLICADTSSSDPLELAGALARDRARVIVVGAVGMHVPRKLYYEKELTLINSRSYGPGRYDPEYETQGKDYPLGYVRWTEGRNLEAFVDLLAQRLVDVKALITHRFSIDQAPEAYALITGKRKEPFLGVLFVYEHQGKAEGGIERRLPAREGTHRTLEAAQTPSAVRLGVLGAGNFAQVVMLPLLRKVPSLELVGIASPSGVSAQVAAKRFGFQYATSDEGQLLHDERVNTIAILTRHHLHARQVVAALEAGKHVFCEKPLALHEEELAQVEEALTYAAGRSILMVGFNRRFAPMAQELKAFLEGRTEPLVAQYRVNAGYLPAQHWTQDAQQGGGRIIGEACHFIDFLTFLVGASPVEVFARGIPDSGRYHQDNLVMTFTFTDGSVGTVSYLANGDRMLPKERLEVFCSGRVAVLDDFRRLELIRQGRRRVLRSAWRQDKGHRGEWLQFVQAIVQGEAAPIPYAQLFAISRAAILAQRALQSGEVLPI